MSVVLPAMTTPPAVSRRRWYVLAILTGVYVSNIADRYVISTLIEPIKADLHLSDTAIGFLTGTALAIFYTGMGIPLGLIADRLDRRKLIALSIGIWSVMTAACGASINFTQLLLARMGVGIGEAGGTPASQSAALVRITVFEPLRGRLDTNIQTNAPTLKETLRFIRTQRSLLHVMSGAAVVTYWGWGLLWWTPAFLMRSHQMTASEAGTLTGTISGIAGALGIVAGGVLIHRLARNEPRWQVWLVAIATLLGTFASVGVYAATSPTTATIMLWLFVPVAYLNLAPILSLTQSLVLPRMRGISCAVTLFGANIANLALAPQIIGFLSDYFRQHSSAGPESLRWALMLTTITGFWATYHFWAAGKHMLPDLIRAGATADIGPRRTY
jgi:MFS family permease